MNQSKKPDGAHILIVTDLLNSKVVSLSGYLLNGGEITATWPTKLPQVMPAEVKTKKLTCTFTWIDVNGAGVNLPDKNCTFTFTPIKGTKKLSPFEDGVNIFPNVINGNGAQNVVIFQAKIEQLGDWDYCFEIDTTQGLVKSESLEFDPEMRIGP